MARKDSLQKFNGKNERNEKQKVKLFFFTNKIEQKKWPVEDA